LLKQWFFVFYRVALLLNPSKKRKAFFAITRELCVAHHAT